MVLFNILHCSNMGKVDFLWKHAVLFEIAVTLCMQTLCRFAVIIAKCLRRLTLSTHSVYVYVCIYILSHLRHSGLLFIFAGTADVWKHDTASECNHIDKMWTVLWSLTLYSRHQMCYCILWVVVIIMIDVISVVVLHFMSSVFLGPGFTSSSAIAERPRCRVG